MSDENLDASKIVAQSGTAEDFIRMIKAEAWDEGKAAGAHQGNPYREKSMTDQDNLRDRIAAVMFAADVESGAIHIDLWTDLKGEYQNAAQAIIDELGLTIETHAATHAKRTMTRITGAWEWEQQR